MDKLLCIPEVLPAPVSPQRIERTAAALAELARTAVLDVARKMGRLVITELYSDGLDGWRQRGTRDSSFRRLAKELAKYGEGSVSRSTLHRCCGLVELEDRLGVSTLGQLTASHGFMVLGLPGSVQAKLLDKARDNGWTVRQLAAEVSGVRRKAGKRRGRQPKARFAASLDRMTKMLEGDGFEDLDPTQLERLSAERRQELLVTARRMQERLTGVIEQLEDEDGD